MIVILQFVEKQLQATAMSKKLQNMISILII